MNQGEQGPVAVMRLRYAGACRECGIALGAGTSAAYDRSSRTVICLACLAAQSVGEGDLPAPVGVDAGNAGASARREFERRSAKREARVREAHPRLGGLILALSDDPQSTKAWAQGARGEELLGARLDGLEDRGVRTLHDRRMPRSRANIDHIAVGPAGVHVIDAKRYADKRPERRVEGWMFGSRTEKLYVGGRDKTALVEGVRGQVAAACQVLDAAGLDDVPVRGVLCFVEADWPLIGGDFTIGDVDVVWPKKLAERLTPKGPLLDEARIEVAYRALAAALRPA